MFSKIWKFTLQNRCFSYFFSGSTKIFGKHVYTALRATEICTLSSKLKEKKKNSGTRLRSIRIIIISSYYVCLLFTKKLMHKVIIRREYFQKILLKGIQVIIPENKEKSFRRIFFRRIGFSKIFDLIHCQIYSFLIYPHSTKVLNDFFALWVCCKRKRVSGLLKTRNTEKNKNLSKIDCIYQKTRHR